MARALSRQRAAWTAYKFCRSLRRTRREKYERKSAFRELVRFSVIACLSLGGAIELIQSAHPARRRDSAQATTFSARNGRRSWPRPFPADSPVAYRGRNGLGAVPPPCWVDRVERFPIDQPAKKEENERRTYISNLVTFFINALSDRKKSCRSTQLIGGTARPGHHFLCWRRETLSWHVAVFEQGFPSRTEEVMAWTLSRHHTG